MIADLKTTEFKSNRIDLNRGDGGFPYEMHLHVRVDGRNIFDAADSVAELVRDHAKELLSPMFPDKMTYPKEDTMEED